MVARAGVGATATLAGADKSAAQHTVVVVLHAVMRQLERLVADKRPRSGIVERHGQLMVYIEVASWRK